MAPDDSFDGSSRLDHHVVVCVAEDADLLTLIRRFFTALPCRTIVTDNSDEALAVLEATRVSLVLADQKQKTTTGSLLLKEVARRSPQTARVLLASFTNGHDQLQTADDTVHGLIAKPWDVPSLQRTILAILHWQEERARLSTLSPEDSSPYNTPTRPVRPL